MRSNQRFSKVQNTQCTRRENTKSNELLVQVSMRLHKNRLKESLSERNTEKDFLRMFQLQVNMKSNLRSLKVLLTRLVRNENTRLRGQSGQESMKLHKILQRE
jgi:hypothetical protein